MRGKLEVIKRSRSICNFVKSDQYVDLLRFKKEALKANVYYELKFVGFDILFTLTLCFLLLSCSVLILSQVVKERVEELKLFCLFIVNIYK